jgi:hypothetical protein
MKRPSSIMGLFAAGVLLFDLAASLISRATGIPYASFSLGSFVIYALCGYLIAKQAPMRLAVMGAAGVALVEATLGWAISWFIGPGRPGEEAARMPVAVGIGAITAIVLGSFFGWIGALVGRRSAAGRQQATTV